MSDQFVSHFERNLVDGRLSGFYKALTEFCGVWIIKLESFEDQRGC
jgi:hypothetical protein